ncbi:MAG: 3-hydroxybutyryl-CoA dehydrogenase [Bacteroidia bacterium]|nr:3-hydroxybutyryl-CoA dehydrogenase [Bacteroidia bacterium]
MKNVAVIGAGTMGNGIAQVFALKDYNVTLIDINANALEQALRTIEKNLNRMISKEKISEDDRDRSISNITTRTDIATGVKNANLVIEAATENLDIKVSIFKEIEQHAPEDSILATNTSSISITRIASTIANPGRVIGMHFMNPVPIMKLVEIIKGYSTSEEVVESVVSQTKTLDKVPVVVNDYPGFIANRILLPMINEAIYALHEGVAGVEEIDSIMKLGMAHPMGPLQLADLIGLDVCLAILRVLHDGFGNPKYAPCPLLVNMVTSGNLGRKTGKGFYNY